MYVYKQGRLQRNVDFFFEHVLWLNVAAFSQRMHSLFCFVFFRSTWSRCTRSTSSTLGSRDSLPSLPVTRERLNPRCVQKCPMFNFSMKP